MPYCYDPLDAVTSRNSCRCSSAWFHATRLSACLTLLLTLAACTPAQMSVPQEVTAGNAPLQVSGRQSFNIFDQRFRFGDYSLESVDRSWTRSTTWGFAGFEDFHASQEYAFVLRTPQGQRWQGNCGVNVDARSLRIAFPDIESEFSWMFDGGASCVCFLNQQGQSHAGASWKLALGLSRSDGLLHGMLTGAGASLAVDATRGLAGTHFSLSEASGYVFSQHGSRIAAVEVLNEGRLWLPTQNNLRDPVAAAAAALLLYQDIGPE